MIDRVTGGFDGGRSLPAGLMQTVLVIMLDQFSRFADHISAGPKTRSCSAPLFCRSVWHSRRGEGCGARVESITGQDYPRSK